MTQKLEQQLEAAHAELEALQRLGDWSLAGQLGYRVIPELERSLLREVESAGSPAVVELVVFLREHAQQKAYAARAAA
jgi:hypothetical protein